MPPGIIWCIAGSIGTNPVIVRKILQQLKAAGLVEVSRGTRKGKSKFMGDLENNFRLCYLIKQGNEVLPK